jgi:hypothetical protein
MRTGDESSDQIDGATHAFADIAIAPTSAAREIASFECGVCGATLETWNTAWVPSYRLVAGPVRMPAEE